VRQRRANLATRAEALRAIQKRLLMRFKVSRQRAYPQCWLGTLEGERPPSAKRTHCVHTLLAEQGIAVWSPAALSPWTQQHGAPRWRPTSVSSFTDRFTTAGLAVCPTPLSAREHTQEAAAAPLGGLGLLMEEAYASVQAAGCALLRAQVGAMS
jgi:hypothetical protein